MAMDSIQATRRVSLTRLKAVQALTALVPADRIYGQSAPAEPAWPFIKWGSFTSLPRRAACLDAAELTGSIHAFAGPRTSGTAIVETAEDHASRIGAEIAKALDGFYGEVPGGVARFQWTRTQLLPDGDADRFHVVVNFRIRCSTNSG